MYERAFIFFITIDDPAKASSIARALVSEKLAACVNIVPGLTSVYAWKGAVESASELLLIVKTSEERIPALKERLPQLHPYQVPELIGWPVHEGLSPYLQWIRDSTI